MLFHRFLAHKEIFVWHLETKKEKAENEILITFWFWRGVIDTSWIRMALTIYRRPKPPWANSAPMKPPPRPPMAAPGVPPSSAPTKAPRPAPRP